MDIGITGGGQVALGKREGISEDERGKEAKKDDKDEIGKGEKTK